MRQMCDSVHLRLDRDRDLLLDLLGGMARPLRDDARVDVGDVGVRFDGQIVERDHAPEEQHHAKAHDHHALAKREIDDAADHRGYCSTVRTNCSPLRTRAWPGVTPCRISWIPSPLSLPPCPTTACNVPAPVLRQSQSPYTDSTTPPAA